MNLKPVLGGMSGIFYCAWRFFDASHISLREAHESLICDRILRNAVAEAYALRAQRAELLFLGWGYQ